MKSIILFGLLISGSSAGADIYQDNNTFKYSLSKNFIQNKSDKYTVPGKTEFRAAPKYRIDTRNPDRYGADKGYLDTSDWVYNTGKGYLKTPGSDSFGYLKTPGGPLQNYGYLETPGSGDYGYLKTPGIERDKGLIVGDNTSQKGFIETPGLETNVSKLLTHPSYNRNLNNSSKYSKFGGYTKSLISQVNIYRQSGPGGYISNGIFKPYDPAYYSSRYDQAPQAPSNANTSIYRPDLTSSEKDLPNPYTPPAESYKPKSIYDRTIPGRGKNGTVYFDPSETTQGGTTNPYQPYHDVDRTQSLNTSSNIPMPDIPNWIIRKSQDGGDWIWGFPQVLDGDNIVLNNKQIRLAGIDAPELNQTCKKGNLLIACGRESGEILSFQIEGQIVACKIHSQDNLNRLVSTCYTKDFEINKLMVQKGLAVLWKQSKSPYESEAQQAYNNQRGIWNTEFLHPSDWIKLKPNQNTIERKQQIDYIPLKKKPEYIQDHKQQEGFPYIPFGKSPKGRMPVIMNLENY